MAKRQKWFIIAYDVRDRKRLQRLYKCVRQEAYALHESVFLFRGTAVQLKAFEAKMKQRIRKNEDDLRIYPVSASAMFAFVGIGINEPGIIIEDLPKFESWNCKND